MKAVSSKQPKINGLMLDPARTLQPLNYYKRVMDHAADWGMNTLLLHLSDDQGCAIKLNTLAGRASPGAWGKREIDILIAHANKRKIELIPEIEAFGHTRYITDLPEFCHLRDDSGKPGAGGELYSGINPCHPKTLDLFEKIFTEVCNLFPSLYLHIGCDEVDFGHSPQVRKILTGKPKWLVYAEYVNALAQRVKGRQRQALFWADHVASEPKIFSVLDKDLIAVDWYYWPITPEDYQKRIQVILNAGHRVIAAPALAYSAWALHPGSEALDTTRSMAVAIKNISSPNVLGLINTVWCPSRIMPDVLWPLIAASGKIVQSPGISQAAIHRKFVRSFYGTKPDKSWRIYFKELYNTSFPLPELAWRVWHNPETLAQALNKTDCSEYDWNKGLETATRLKKTIKKNKAVFQTVSLAFRLRQHLDDRAKATRRLPGLHKLSRKDKAIRNSFLRIWKKYYIPKHPLKSPLRFNPNVDENIYAVLCRAAEFSKALVKRSSPHDV